MTTDEKGMDQWQFCPLCGADLDMGWECNGCGTDWIELAFPWYWRDRLKLGPHMFSRGQRQDTGTDTDKDPQ